MPIYEYKCSDCGTFFEHLQLGEPKTINCPECQSGNIEKQFSSFAAPKGAASPCTPRCGASEGCCGHSGRKCFE